MTMGWEREGAQGRDAAHHTTRERQVATWRDEYRGIPGADYAAHNAARVKLHGLIRALSAKDGFKRDFSRTKYDGMTQESRERIAAFVSQHLPEQWACLALNELPADLLHCAADSISRHYGVQPIAAAEPAAEAVAAPRVAKGRVNVTPLAWGNVLGQ